MTPDQYARARKHADAGLIVGNELLCVLLAHIDQQDETIAALRAGQGTHTGDTR